jgi:DHA1 family multidrug/chloramphenicol efflux transport protein-like MFS transporter
MRFWFPAFLVLFEFSTYISNDMIMPGMPRVVHEFHVGIGSASLALTAALLGNVALQWLLGPLSDYKGRRPVLLVGVAFFIASCLGMFFAQTMTQFVVLRGLQGMGCAFVAAVGYPSVQEAFDEATAVRTVALMASVALLAPLLGPLLGAWVVTVWSWRMVFGVIAAIASIGFCGLWVNMPETAGALAHRGTAPGSESGSAPRFSLRQLVRDYVPVLRNRRILLGATALGFACVPLMNWIALAPVILIDQHHLTPLSYGWWQLPVFGAMILGHVIVARVAGRWSLERLMRAGMIVMVAGVFAAYLGYVLTGAFTGAVTGFAIYALGLGPFYASIYRQALFASDGAKGAVAAAINTLFMLLMALGVESSKSAYVAYGEPALLGAGAVAIVVALFTARGFAHRMRVANRSEIFGAVATEGQLH